MIFRLLAAWCYDALILLALFMLLTAMCVLANAGQAIAPGCRWYQALLLVTFVGYQIVSLRGCGQTIGMRAWRLKVVNAHEKVSILQVIGRLLLTIPAHIVALALMRKPQQVLSKWTHTQLVLVR